MTIPRNAGAANAARRGLKRFTVLLPPQLFADLATAAAMSRPADCVGRWSTSRWLAGVAERAVRDTLTGKNLLENEEES